MSNTTKFEQDILDRAQSDDAWFGGTSVDTSTSTPWGRAQYGYRYGVGVTHYGTAGHGGFKVSAKLFDSMPQALREVGDNGWFEEDVESAAVVVAFPERFNRPWVEQAISSLKNSFPFAWQEFAGVELSLDESLELRRRHFHAEHANDWLVVSAQRVPNDRTLVEVTATIGGRRDRAAWADQREFVIDGEAYDARGPFGFVIPSELVEV